MALPVDPDLALGVLQTLARFQGTKVDARTEEEPGRILHEMRFGEAATLSLGGGTIYYGTADATPLFVVLLGELRRWGLAAEVVDALAPNAEAAVNWLVELRRRRRRRLHRVPTQDRPRPGRTKAGRTPGTAIQFANGDDRARADRARPRCRATPTPRTSRGRTSSTSWAAATSRARGAQRAADLKQKFNEDFWLEDKQCFAVALDAEKRPVDSDRRRTRVTACGPASWRPKGRRRWRRRCSRRTCSRAGAYARCPPRATATTRSATTPVRSGPTTTRSSWPAWCATASSTKRT